MSAAGENDSDRWRRRRQAAALITAASIGWGSVGMSGCATTDCVAVRTDQATPSLVGSTDGHPGEPVKIDTGAPSPTGGASTFARAGVATATATANGATIRS
jgi:hypothetical protein